MPANNAARTSAIAASLFFFLFIIGDTLAQPDPRPWWDTRWRYRLSLTVDVGPYERTDKPVEQFVNFTSLLAGIGRAGTVIQDSLRVVEVNSEGDVIDDSVPFQYDAVTSASGDVVFVLTGTTPESAQRYYHVYFDTQGDFAPAEVTAQVQLTDDVSDEGQAAYRIVTANGTYYYQKEAGGFSSLLDVDGNDWISFHPWGGSDGIYRGIPNMVHPDNIFHPGHKNCTSTVLRAGPLKVTIRTVSNNDLWECLWEIYPYYARMTLLRKADQNYWFLYEGTPGGKLDLTTDYSVRSNGIRLPVQESWREQDIPFPEWVYFEDSILDRYIYLVHEEDDFLSDDFWQMQSNMTVLGFGRTQNVNDKQLSRVPAHFTIGLADGAEFSAASVVIEASYRPVTVTVGAVNTLADFDGNDRVGLSDLDIWCSCWLTEGKSRCDMDQDDFVALTDFAHFSRFWNPNPGPLSDLQGCWMFDEGQGSFAMDASDFGNHGIVSGAAWNPLGKSGSALEFDGLGDYVQIQGYKGVLGMQARAVTAWVSTDNSGYMDIISWGKNLPGQAWILQVTLGSRFEPEGALRLTVTGGYVTGRTRITDGQWHHIGAVFEDDGSPDVSEVKLYVDGQQETTSRVVSQAVDTVSGDDVRIGVFSAAGDRYFGGLIDEVRIYSRALDSTEIANMAK